MTLGDTITPTATAIRTKLLGDTAVSAAVGQRVYMPEAPASAAYPHVIMRPVDAPEADATHADLSWQPQQWDIYAVADTADSANDIAGKVSLALNDARLTLSGAGNTLIVRRQGTMPASRVRLSDTISKFMAAATMLVGVRTGGN